jgi:putative ABC transport system permease protein
MQLRIILLQFWRDMKAHRLRTGLTLFGLGWGTFCVIVLLSFGEGLQRRQYEQAASMGERLLLIWGSRTSIPHEGLPRGRRIALQDSDVDAILQQVPGIAQASPEYSAYSVMQGPAGQASAGIAGVRPCFGDMRNVVPEPGGRFVNETDEAQRRRVAVIGAQVRKDLFGSTPAIGRTLEIRGVPFLVVGTIAKKQQNSNYNGQDDGKVFIPASVAQASLGQREPDNLVVEIEKGADGKEVLAGINRVMGRIHHYDSSDKEALMTWDVGEMLAMFLTIFLGFKVFLSILGALTLAVAGIGVANIMSMVVEDRTAQIGISMALGARRRWVLGQILVETLVVTGVGGGLGVLFAAAVVSAARFLPLGEMGTPTLSWQIALLTAGLLGTIGIASGLGPARRAANLNPAEALRS